MEALACGNKKAGQLLSELDDKRGIGLITRVRQGQGKPDKIFVHKCVLPEMLKGHFQKCQNDMSGNVEMTGLDMSKGHANKTDRNNTEYSETQSIYQAEQMWMEDGTKEYEEYREYFMDCMERSFYDTGGTAVYGDKLLTLSTCEYSQKNGRMVVLAKRLSEGGEER